jgi:hypothetical protein
MIRAAFVLLATPCWRSENTGAGRGPWGLPSSGPTWCCQTPRLAIAALGIQPILALMVSYVLPILLLPIALYLMRLRTQ